MYIFAIIIEGLYIRIKGTYIHVQMAHLLDFYKNFVSLLQSYFK